MRCGLGLSKYFVNRNNAQDIRDRLPAASGGNHPLKILELFAQITENLQKERKGFACRWQLDRSLDSLVIMNDNAVKA